jgi:hypothetical protein
MHFGRRPITSLQRDPVYARCKIITKSVSRPDKVAQRSATKSACSTALYLRAKSGDW